MPVFVANATAWWCCTVNRRKLNGRSKSSHTAPTNRVSCTLDCQVSSPGAECFLAERQLPEVGTDAVGRRVVLGHLQDVGGRVVVLRTEQEGEVTRLSTRSSSTLHQAVAAGATANPLAC